MNEKTRKVLDIFSQINMIPRCSKQEARIAKWLLDWAGTNGFRAVEDDAGNMMITVPATAGYEGAPVIVIQGHMDMVCEKTPESDHDFSKDPIKMRYEGDWVTADRTTLGADNGIALAIAMALATDKTIEHPPLELLFTVDEETGLNGAKKLAHGFFSGKIFLNIDSEIEGVFTVGCAGGKDIHVKLPFEPSPVTAREKPMKISVKGLCGGHSGIDIIKQRANANILLARSLEAIQKAVEIRMVTIAGGTVHNAIPRDAEVVVTLDESKFSEVRRIVATFEQTAGEEYAATESTLQIVTASVPSDPSGTRALTVNDTTNVIQLLLALPNGVDRMSPEMAGLVETSNNLATIGVKDNMLCILSSQRSSKKSTLDAISSKIGAVAALAGATIETEQEYPAWPPEMSSPLLARCREVYQEVFNTESVVEVIHAGLECAIIGSKFEGVDMISFGPDLENPHSPDERLNIPSIEKVWNFTTALLKSYKP